MTGRMKTLAMVSDSPGEHADFGRSDAARKIVWAFDTPPSQRPTPPGLNAASPLLDHHIEMLYGPRFRDGWVAVFERRGWSAPPDQNPQRSVVLERIYFLVGGDIKDERQLLEVFRRVYCGSLVAQMSRSPYVMWHMADRDALWRAGVVPITGAQVPNKPIVGGGDANQQI